jgi:L-malate glycosyltransferase
MPGPVPILLMVRALGLGGTERQLTETARFLDRNRFEPHVGCLIPEGFRHADLVAAGVPILSVPVQSFASVAAIRGAFQIARYIRQHKIQIVHTFDVPMNVYGVPTGRFARAPIVLSSQRAHRSLNTPTFRRILRGLDHVVDGVVVNCEAMRQHLIDDERTPERIIHVCYNGIETDVYFPAPTERPAVLQGATVIGVVCALRPEKGLPTLVAAFATVRAQFPNTKLLIVGSGPEEQPLKELAGALGISGDCHFEPGTAEVAQWLRCIDIFVLPSLSEALSNSLMEAMACGCCPVATRVGGNPELINPDETGLLFEPGNVEDLGDRLRLLLGNEELRSRLAQASVQRIHSRFTHSAATRSMSGIYETMLEKRAGDTLMD